MNPQFFILIAAQYNPRAGIVPLQSARLADSRNLATFATEGSTQ